MADNPRLTIELVDRSGANGVASTGPQSNAPQSTGSDAVEDFQRKVTVEGAAGDASQSSPSPSPDPIGSALDNQTRQNNAIPASPTPGYQGMQPANASLGNVVSGILQADPTAKADEIAGLLGITRDSAQGLIDQARGTNTPPPSPTPPPIPASPLPPPASDPYGGLQAGSGAPSMTRQGPVTDPITGEVLPSTNQPAPGPTSGYEGIPGTRNYQPLSGPAIDPITGRPQDIPPVAPQAFDDGYGGMGGGPSNYQPLRGAPVDPVLGNPAGPQRPDDGYGGLGGGGGGGGNGPRGPNIDPVTGEVIEDSVSLRGSSLASMISSTLRRAGLLPQGAEGLINQIGTTLPAVEGMTGSSLAAIGSTIGGVGLALGGGYLGYRIADNEAQRAVALSREFSPDTIGALAQAEVNQIMANLRTSRTLGDEAGDYVRASGRLSNSLQGIRDTASEPLLQQFNSVLGKVASLTETIDNNTKSGTSKVITQGIIGGLIEAGNPVVALSNTTDRLYSLFQSAKEEKKVELGQWFDGTFPFLEPPAPFNKAGNEKPMMAPIPGLNML